MGETKTIVRLFALIVGAAFLTAGSCDGGSSSSGGGGGGGAVATPQQWTSQATGGGSTQPGSQWTSTSTTGGSAQPGTQWIDPQNVTSGGTPPPGSTCIPYPDGGPIMEPLGQNGIYEQQMLTYINNQRTLAGGGFGGLGGFGGGGGGLNPLGSYTTTRNSTRAHLEHMSVYHPAMTLTANNPEGDNPVQRLAKCNYTLGIYNLQLYEGTATTDGTAAAQTFNQAVVLDPNWIYASCAYWAANGKYYFAAMFHR